MENQWLAYAKRLQAIASTGLAYTQNQFDRERFEEINTIAASMLSRLFVVPIERIADLAPDATAYPTPKVEVRGAVVKDDRILLVRERFDGRWTLPGGFAEIGLSAAENVVKEVREEASIEVVAAHLYSVRHKAKGPFEQDPRDFYKFYFLCEQTDERTPRPGPETLDAAFFELDALPELSRSRTVEEDLVRALQCHRDPGRATLFD